VTDLRDALLGRDGNARRAIEYAVVTKAVVDGAKEPGFGAASWNPLRDMIEVDEFVRVGNFKETMDWAGYVGFLTGWAPAAQWDATFKRVTEVDGRVFLELEERSTIGDLHSVVNSLSVYEFNAAGKITHIDVYLQMPLPPPELLAGYQDVEITR
jgi:hypothetical protein